jgi:thiamine-phosphate pyrophosphorylase
LELADAGVRLMQLRDKRASPRDIHLQTREFVEHLSPRGVRLIVNDRADIAAMAGAGGVHVGQEDLAVEEARRICGPPPAWVGVSTHNLDQLREAARTSADYIAVGPLFPTTTKANPEPVVGIEFLREARGLTRKPIVAIGGITVERAADVFRAGADSVAVIRDLALARDPGARAREYLAIAERVRMGRS